LERKEHKERGKKKKKELDAPKKLHKTSKGLCGEESSNRPGKNGEISVKGGESQQKIKNEEGLNKKRRKRSNTSKKRKGFGGRVSKIPKKRGEKENTYCKPKKKC